MEKQVIVIKQADGTTQFVIGVVETKTKEQMIAEAAELNAKIDEICQFTGTDELMSEYDEKIHALEAERDEKIAALKAEHEKEIEGLEGMKERLAALNELIGSVPEKEETKQETETAAAASTAAVNPQLVVNG